MIARLAAPGQPLKEDDLICSHYIDYGDTTVLKASIIFSLSKVAKKNANRPIVNIVEIANLMCDVFTRFEALLRNEKSNENKYDILTKEADCALRNLIGSVAEDTMRIDILAGRYLGLLLRITK